MPKKVEELEEQCEVLKKETCRANATLVIVMVCVFNIVLFIRNPALNGWSAMGIIILEVLGLFIYAKGHKKYGYIVNFFRDLYKNTKTPPK